MKTTTNKGTAGNWDMLWTAFTTAKRAGADLSAEKAAIRSFHAQHGWAIPAWAY